MQDQQRIGVILWKGKWLILLSLAVGFVVGILLSQLERRRRRRRAKN